MLLAAVATAVSSPLLGGQGVLGVDDPGAVRFLGITLVGVSATTGVKLLVTAGFLLVVRVLRAVALAVLRRALGGEVADPRRFWARQGIHVVVAIVVVLGVVSIWVTPGSDLTTGIGLVTAGLAFALQQVVLSLAAYVVILRGDTFGVGDRIVLDEVRGDVVRLGFLKTTIMEMGTPPPATDGEGSGSWVASRQYTGRLVTVTNDAVFKKPVYNDSRDFPYLWEEIVLPISYGTDRVRTEEILLHAARAHAVVDDAEPVAAMAGMRARYAVAETPWRRRSTAGSPTTGWSCPCVSSFLTAGSAR